MNQGESAEAPPHQSHGRPKQRPWPKPRLFIIGLVLIALLVAGAGSVAYHSAHRRTNPFPSDVVATVNFPLYFPAYIPKGYALETKSFSATFQVMTYYFKNAEDKKIHVSIQPPPKDFNFKDFYYRDLTANTDVNIDYGTAEMGYYQNGKILGSIVAPGAWILVNGPENLGAQEMTRLIQGFYRVNSTSD